MEGSRSRSKKTKKSQSRFKKFFNFIRSLFGKKTKKSFSSIISHLLDSYEKEGLINTEEKKMFKNIITFGDKKVSSIMTPRSDIIAIQSDATLEKIKKTVSEEEHSRIPVFKENFDEIIGFIHSKDLVKHLYDSGKEFLIAKILRKIIFVPGAMKLSDVMLRMKMARVHIAIVLDEFGGIDGLVTIENIMEEIVGEIEDEHDIPSDSSFFRIKEIGENKFQFGGRVEIKKMEKTLHKRIKQNDEEFQTVGGFVMSAFSGVPEIGDKIIKDELKIKVIDADSRVVKLVEIEKS